MEDVLSRTKFQDQFSPTSGYSRSKIRSRILFFSIKHKSNQIRHLK